MTRFARRGRNLRTVESLKIPATRAVRFRIGKRFEMPLPDRNASGPGKVRSSCRLPSSTVETDWIRHRARVDVLPLAKAPADTFCRR